ncbi:MAG: DUF4350 domain-containing protein [Anaerolineae bacterium]|nr:DUF4350 domain-containing protein [Anaerolineae bacterium]
MKRPSRDTWLAIGLLTILVIVTIAAAVYQTGQEEGKLPPLASFSSAPDGARALRLWLEQLDYTVGDEVGESFRPPDSADVALILEPTTPITEQEWQTIDAWIDRGGTLVLAGEGRWFTSNMPLAVGHYGFQMTYPNAREAITLTAQSPLLTSPPLKEPAHARPNAYLRPDHDDFVTHLAVGSKPVLVSFPQGQGRVIICTAAFPFTNAGLKEEGNPELALNVVTTSSRPDSGGKPAIWFDEWHHGVQPRRSVAAGPQDWLRYTPSGRAVLYTAAVIFAALALGGRRFGRAVPLPKRIARRAPLEHITAIANLSRRAGHRQAVLRYHYQRLKRDLGKRYRLSPTLPDDEYAAQLAEFNPNVDPQELLSLLARLQKRKVSESEMIQLAAEVAAWLKE